MPEKVFLSHQSILTQDILLDNIAGLRLRAIFGNTNNCLFFQPIAW